MSRLGKYHALGLRKVPHDSPVKKALGKGLFQLQDNSFLVTEREEEEAPKQKEKSGPEQEGDEADEGESNFSPEHYTSNELTLTTTPVEDRRTVVMVGVAFSGVQLSLPYEAAFVSDNCVVLRGPDPAPFDPQVDDEAQEQPVYELTVRGKVYRCCYGGVSFKEAANTKTLVFFRE